MKRFRDQRGFTLIEMMVVLAIIALIAVFAVPNIQNSMANSRIKSVEAQARQIQNAFDQYYNDKNDYPAGPTSGDTVAVAYGYFFDTTAGSQGDLTQYLSLPSAIGDALFIPRVYGATNSDSTTSATYELVLEVKNVATDAKYIHITKTAVTRTSADTSTEAVDWSGSGS